MKVLYRQRYGSTNSGLKNSLHNFTHRCNDEISVYIQTIFWMIHWKFFIAPYFETWKYLHFVINTSVLWLVRNFNCWFIHQINRYHFWWRTQSSSVVLKFSLKFCCILTVNKPKRDIHKSTAVLSKPGMTEKSNKWRSDRSFGLYHN